MFARFFVDRPIFATVLSLVIVIVGLVALTALPIAQYPEVAPPTIQVSAIYPGANAETVATTVATPIEQEVNGVERMLYMASRCTNDGQMFLDVTFELGTNLDTAQVLVQNRVSVAEAKLPEDVKRIGVTTKKKSPSILLCVNLVSEKRPDGSFYYDQLYLSNYASLSVKDDLARVKGVGDVTFLGPRDYSMRVWLDPQKLASLGMTAADVIKAIREQNVQVAAGRLGQPPVAAGAAVPFQLVIKTQGRLSSEQQFDDIIVKTGSKGEVVKLRDVVRKVQRDEHGRIVEKGIGAGGQELRREQLPRRRSVGHPGRVPVARLERPEDGRRHQGEDEGAEGASFPRAWTTRSSTTPRVFIDESVHEVYKTLFEAFILVFIVVLIFLQDWRATIMPMIDVPVSLIGTFAVMAVMGFSLNNLTLVRPGAGHRHRRRRRHRGLENIERWMAKGLPPREATIKAMDEITGPVIAITLVLSSVFIPTAFPGRHHRAVLPPVRPDDRRLDDHFGHQRHDHGPGAGGHADQAAHGRQRRAIARPCRAGASRVLIGIARLSLPRRDGLGDASACRRRAWARKLRRGPRAGHCRGALGRAIGAVRRGERAGLVRRPAGQRVLEQLPRRLQLGLRPPLGGYGVLVRGLLRVSPSCCWWFMAGCWP